MILEYCACASYKKRYMVFNSFSTLAASIVRTEECEHQRLMEGKRSYSQLDRMRDMLAKERGYGSQCVSGDQVLENIEHMLGLLMESPDYAPTAMQLRVIQRFVRASLRIIYRSDFTTAAARLMKRFGVNMLSQEVLCSAPRRAGKTMATCIFLAVMLRCVPNLTICVFSTGRRASKLLLDLVNKILSTLPGGKEMIETTGEETMIVVNRSDESDRRKISSFPARVDVSFLVLYISNEYERISFLGGREGNL